MAPQLIQSGFTGPAAALLVVLPAISLPCMMLLGGSLQRFRVVALLSIAVMIVGIPAGALFLEEHASTHAVLLSPRSFIVKVNRLLRF